MVAVCKVHAVIYTYLLYRLTLSSLLGWLSLPDGRHRRSLRGEKRLSVIIVHKSADILLSALSALAQARGRACDYVLLTNTGSRGDAIDWIIAT